MLHLHTSSLLVTNPIGHGLLLVDACSWVQLLLGKKEQHPWLLLHAKDWCLNWWESLCHSRWAKSIHFNWTMLIYSNQAPAWLPALLQSVPLGSQTRALRPLINQGLATPHTHLTLVFPVLPKQENSKAIDVEVSVTRSHTSQRPIENQKLVLLALTRTL